MTVATFLLITASTMAANAMASSAMPAQDPFAGVFQGGGIRLTLVKSESGYRGSIELQGSSLPLTAAPASGGLKGSFHFQNNTFPFEIRRRQEGLVLITDGETYQLEPAAKPVNPLARKAAPQAPDAAEPSAVSPPVGIVGTWRNGQGTMRFDAGGAGVANGEPFRYEVARDVLTIRSEVLNASFRVAIEGDKLRLIGPDRQVILTRVDTSPPPGGGRVQADLSGKWCYVSNVNATGGGARATNQCFTLYPDGRYDYYGETDSYGPAGGATSQGSDSGTWIATETTLTARSRTGKVTTFGLEKRNHPKTNDPMLVLDGATFVTFHQKPSW
jgi:hypothetical protein